MLRLKGVGELMFSLQPQGWTTWKRVFFRRKKKKQLMPTLLYGFSHQSGNLINRDSEKKKKFQGVYSASTWTFRLQCPLSSSPMGWNGAKKMQITGSYTKCVLHQPLFNMRSAVCLYNYAFSRLVSKEQSSKHTVLVGSRNTYSMHSNFLSSRSIPNWPCWLRELDAWIC